MFKLSIHVQKPCHTREGSSKELISYYFTFIFYKNMSILSVHARQILHCRGNPTVEVDISTNKGKLGRFSQVKMSFFAFVTHLSYYTCS